jgi:hypothetical protein
MLINRYFADPVDCAVLFEIPATPSSGILQYQASQGGTGSESVTRWW